MSICAVAKKRLAFHDDKGSFIVVNPGEFVTLPDYVRKDPMFAWATKDGSLQVSEQVISAVETPVDKGEKAEAATVENPAKKATRKAAEK
ncbi:MAG: hypothetical protein IIZ55_08105 [Firmicutes bacterium]|nr:hypothetical protein [Bacillota bacterium]